MCSIPSINLSVKENRVAFFWIVAKRAGPHPESDEYLCAQKALRLRKCPRESLKFLDFNTSYTDIHISTPYQELTFTPEISKLTLIK